MSMRDRRKLRRQLQSTGVARPRLLDLYKRHACMHEWWTPMCMH